MVVRHPGEVVLPARGQGTTVRSAAPLLVSRADPDGRQALLAVGHPYFAPRAGGGRIGVWLAGTTDWDEIRELVTESYWVPAPKKPIARLEWAAPPSSPTLMVSPCLGR